MSDAHTFIYPCENYVTSQHLINIEEKLTPTAFSTVTSAAISSTAHYVVRGCANSRDIKTIPCELRGDTPLGQTSRVKYI